MVTDSKNLLDPIFDIYDRKIDIFGELFKFLNEKVSAMKLKYETIMKENSNIKDNL